MKYLIICISFSLPGFLIASDAIELINNHLTAAGGIKEHQAIKSITRIGKIKFYKSPYNQAHSIFNYRTDIIYPNNLRENLSKRDTILVDRGTDGFRYWQHVDEKYLYVNDPQVLQGMNETALKANRSLLYIDNDSYMLVKVRKPLWASGDHCIYAKNGDDKFHLCFDKKSHLLKTKGNSEEYRILSNWKNVSGLWLPFTLTHYLKGKKVYEVRLEQINKDHYIPINRFQMPTQ